MSAWMPASVIDAGGVPGTITGAVNVTGPTPYSAVVPAQYVEVVRLVRNVSICAMRGSPS
jgi:hypothetical protein